MSRQLFCDLPDVAEHELILHLWSRLQTSTPKIMQKCMLRDKHETDKLLTAMKGLGTAAQACQQAIKDGDQTKFNAMDR